MVSIKSQPDISFLLSETLRQNNLEKNIEKMGLDLRDIQGSADVSKEAQIRRVSVQFEEMLINSLLKDAIPKDSNKEDDSEDGSEEEKPLLHFGPVRDFRIMLMSQHIAENGGLGYQQIIEQHIKEKYFNPDDSNTKRENPVTQSLQSLPVKSFGRQARPTEPKAPADTPSYPYKDVERMVQPVEAEMSSDYGWRIDPLDGRTRFHKGIDFDVPPQTPVKSFMAGEVVSSGWEKGYGNLIEIRHPNGYTTRYGHNGTLLAKEGDKVEAGDVIALSGSTGRSTGPHLHFEVRIGKQALDPTKVLKNMNPEYYAKLKP
jgi:murein DD-endopeptidase MepM/ murein hydrolase activator NlpD